MSLSRPLAMLSFAGALSMFAACSGGAECSEKSPCEFGEMCISGQCFAAQCSNSSQCPMESYCKDRECIAGCTADSDCYPGTACDIDASTCVEAACEETAVDCGFREFCNTGTGDCYDAGDLYCHACDEDWECGGDNICYAGYCAVSCAGGRECPSGFECYGFEDDVGNVVSYNCFTYCWLYEDVATSAVSTPPLPPQETPLNAFPVSGETCP